MYSSRDVTPTTETRRRPTVRYARLTVLALLFGALIGVTGCSVFTGQIEVTGTDQRLIVGHDAWPFKRIWVLENGKFHNVNVRFQ